MKAKLIKTIEVEMADRVIQLSPKEALKLRDSLTEALFAGGFINLFDPPKDFLKRQKDGFKKLREEKDLGNCGYPSDPQAFYDGFDCNNVTDATEFLRSYAKEEGIE